MAALGLGGVGLVVAAGGGQARPTAPTPVATTLVVVSGRALAASSILTGDELRTLRIPSSAVADALAHDPGSVVGRRLLVPVSAGTPLAPALLAAPGGGPPPPRLVPLTIPTEHVSLPVTAGEEVDIVAAEPAPGGAPGGRVEVVGSGRLVSLGPRQRHASLDPSGGADMVLLLACDEAAAMRLLWAQSFAHTLSAVARPEDARPLPSLASPPA